MTVAEEADASDAARDSRLFLEALFRGQPEGTLLGVGHLVDKKWRSHFVTTPTSALDYLVGSVDGFIRTTPMTGRPKSGRGDDSLSAALMGAFFDIDVNGAPDGRGGTVTNAAASMDVAMELSHALLEPTLLVDSGYGLHPYVLFDEPHLLATEDDRAAANELLAGWHARMREVAHEMGVRKLDSVGQLARVMRVPGTMNGKGQHPVPVRLIDDGGPRYALAEVAKHARRVAKPKPVALLPDESVTALLGRHEDLRKAVGRKGKAPGDGSGSAWDFTIGCKAAEHDLSDAEIGALVRHSRKIHDDEKGEREDYVERTVAAVRQRVGYPAHDPEDILPDLTKHCELSQVDRRIVAIRTTGDDGPTSWDLDDGSEVFFPRFSDMASPAKLGDTLATYLGVWTTFTTLQARKVAGLARRYIGHAAAVSRSQSIRDIVLEMLGQTIDHPFVHTAQDQRWAAWKTVRDTAPAKDAVDPGPEAFARQMVVPRDTATDDRFVRASWVQTYLRRYGLRENPNEIADMLGHIGWERRGKVGHIKATAPDGDETFKAAFYIVPGHWEQDDWSVSE